MFSPSSIIIRETHSRSQCNGQCLPEERTMASRPCAPWTQWVKKSEECVKRLRNQREYGGCNSGQPLMDSNATENNWDSNNQSSWWNCTEVIRSQDWRLKLGFSSAGSWCLIPKSQPSTGYMPLINPSEIGVIFTNFATKVQILNQHLLSLQLLHLFGGLITIKVFIIGYWSKEV